MFPACILAHETRNSHGQIMHAVTCLQTGAACDSAEAPQRLLNSLRYLQMPAGCSSGSVSHQLMYLRDAVIFLEFWKYQHAPVETRRCTTLATALISTSGQVSSFQTRQEIGARPLIKHPATLSSLVRRGPECYHSGRSRMSGHISLHSYA